tara:strand:- start:791924 stop:792247 length:324 start_codon:yes stop_codon:yes gene_type:complete
MAIFVTEHYSELDLQREFNWLKNNAIGSDITHMVVVNYFKTGTVSRSEDFVLQGRLTDEQIQDAGFLLSKFNVLHYPSKHQSVTSIYDLRADNFEKAAISFARLERN